MKTDPLLAIIADRRTLLDSVLSEEQVRDLREDTRTGRPPGNSSFPDRLEEMVGRVLRPAKRGRPSSCAEYHNLYCVSSGFRYYTGDANFNVTAAIDVATGDIVERYVHTPYGKEFVNNSG